MPAAATRIFHHLWRSSAGIYHIRFVVPVRLRAAFDGRREYKRSLGTRDPRAAELAAYQFGLDVRQWLMASKL